VDNNSVVLQGEKSSDTSRAQKNFWWKEPQVPWRGRYYDLVTHLLIGGYGDRRWCGQRHILRKE